MFRKIVPRFHPAILEKAKSSGVATYYTLKEERAELEKESMPIGWGPSRVCIDFDDGHFVLLKENAMFRTDGVLKMTELRAIMKKDPEVTKWYNDLLKPQGPSTEEDDEARKAATEANLDRMEEEDEAEDVEEQGVVSEEGEGIDEDYRFHRQCNEEGDFNTMNEVSELLSNLCVGGLQLVPYSSSSSSSSSSSGR